MQRKDIYLSFILICFLLFWSSSSYGATYNASGYWQEDWAIYYIEQYSDDTFGLALGDVSLLGYADSSDLFWFGNIVDNNRYEITSTLFAGLFPEDSLLPGGDFEDFANYADKGLIYLNVDYSTPFWNIAIENGTSFEMVSEDTFHREQNIRLTRWVTTASLEEALTDFSVWGEWTTLEQEPYVSYTDTGTATRVAPVPEPATMLLLGTGLVGFAGFRKKFRKV